MFIYEKMCCNECKSIYKGKFKLISNGKVVCYDCENKIHLDDFIVTEFTEESMDNDLEAELVLEMLKSDLDYLYINNDKDIEKLFINGQIDLKKLYFMGNPLDLVIEAQKISHVAVRYLEGSQKRYESLAKQCIETYKLFRENSYTEEDIQKLWEFYLSEEVLELSLFDENWKLK